MRSALCLRSVSGVDVNVGFVSFQFSKAMSQTIVQKLNGLQYIEPLLPNSNNSLQKTVMSLVGNLSRNPALTSNLGEKSVLKVVYTTTEGAVGV